jgi:hypothetical protein
MNRIKKKEEDNKILSIYFSAGYPNLNDTNHSGLEKRRRYDRNRITL